MKGNKRLSVPARKTVNAMIWIVRFDRRASSDYDP